MAESILFLQWQKELFHRKRQSFQRKNLSRKEQKTDIFQQATVWRLKLSEKIDGEVRVVVPGHIQRGGNPCAFDRVLTSRIGVKGAELILNKQYGRMVAVTKQQ